MVSLDYKDSKSIIFYHDTKSENPDGKSEVSWDPNEGGQHFHQAAEGKDLAPSDRDLGGGFL